MSNRGAMPLRKGDKVVFELDGEEHEGEVTGRTKHKVGIRGEFGKMTLAIEDEDGVAMKLTIKREDADGRELLRE